MHRHEGDRNTKAPLLCPDRCRFEGERTIEIRKRKEEGVRMLCRETYQKMKVFFGFITVYFLSIRDNY